MHSDASIIALGFFTFGVGPVICAPPTPQPRPRSLGEHLTLCPIDQLTAEHSSGMVSTLFFSGAPSPRRSAQAAATAKPAESLGHRPLQSGLCRKGDHRSLPRSSGSERERRDGGGRVGGQERARGLKSAVKRMPE